MKILSFSGSLRRASLNRALLRAAEQAAPEGMTFETYDLGSLPLYNGDLEAQGFPESVSEFRNAISGCDGLLMATPEYNHGMSGVLKNAIDWASRPGSDKAMVLPGKPAGILGASPGKLGTARSHDQLRHTLKALNVYCMLKPEVLVSGAGDKFDPDGRLTDQGTREFLEKYMKALKGWIERLG